MQVATLVSFIFREVVDGRYIFEAILWQLISPGRQPNDYDASWISVVGRWGPGAKASRRIPSLRTPSDGDPLPSCIYHFPLKFGDFGNFRPGPGGT